MATTLDNIFTGYILNPLIGCPGEVKNHAGILLRVCVCVCVCVCVGGGGGGGGGGGHFSRY